MTRPEQLAYVKTLDPQLQQMFVALDDYHKAAADTLDESFQMVADLLDAFDKRTASWIERQNDC